VIEICEGEMAWLDMCFNVNKSCLLRCGPRYKKPCVAILLNGNLLREWSTVKYLGVTFESGLKLKVSLVAKRIEFFGAFNYIYMSVLGPLPLQCYCVIYFIFIVCRFYYMVLNLLPFLMLIAKPFTLLEKTALYKIFKLNDEVNLLYVQYCLGILPIFYVFDLRRLCFLFKQSTHIISVHNIFTMCLLF